ncbi:MAG: ABC transporter ATP-binding protein [Oscillospiraceae bacterium]|jgi:branched-chain amino acid transport system ATP-binding protein|nr:ABC transporter ATP-binding protein [Oscillospiraceae bacterium]
MATDKNTVLAIDNLTMKFGGVTAIDDLSLHVNRGEIVALIGPNGAGKTTAFNVITGVYEATSGGVSFGGSPIPKGITPDKITKLGIARTFQNIRIFGSMTVLENILVAKHMRTKQNVLTATFRLSRNEEKRVRREAEELLDDQGLLQMKDEIASSLPYGLQRHLEIARALATDPQLILLDEPAAGMNPQETQELAAFVKRIREKHGLTVFIIEHHMDLVMQISDRIYVLDFGKLIASGTPKQIQTNKRVIDAYLGSVEEDEPADIKPSALNAKKEGAVNAES